MSGEVFSHAESVSIDDEWFEMLDEVGWRNPRVGVGNR